MRGLRFVPALVLALAAGAPAGDAARPATPRVVHFRLHLGVEAPRVIAVRIDESILLDLDGDGSPETQRPLRNGLAELEIEHEGVTWSVSLVGSPFARGCDESGRLPRWMSWTARRGDDIVTFRGEVEVFATAKRAAEEPPIALGRPFTIHAACRVEGPDSWLDILVKDAAGLDLDSAAAGRGRSMPFLGLVRDGRVALEERAEYG